MKRRRGLAKRFGHFGMKQVEDATASIRKLAKDNPDVTAVGIGAGVGAMAAGLGVGTAALLGGAAGYGVEKLTGK